MSSGKEVSKWADRSMYEAVPTNTTNEGVVEPTVRLISMTSDPLGVVASASSMYEGVPRDLSDITTEMRHRYFDDIVVTRLQAPFEFVRFHFLIEGVTRAFTHQLVRQRTAVYVQESQRFAVKTNGEHEVALPPSLQGTLSYDEWSVKLMREHGAFADMSYWVERVNDERQRMRLYWDLHVKRTADVYNKLVDMGLPAEDARGLLPTNITTRVHYNTDLRNLIGHAGNRLCTQAQFEWRKVFAGIAQAIREGWAQDSRMIALGTEPGEHLPNQRQGWRIERDSIKDEYRKLSTLFQPICYQTGKCEFMASMDRHCNIRDRVQANHEAGRPSSEWSKDAEGIPAIHPEEWLLDPASARTKEW